MRVAALPEISAGCNAIGPSGMSANGVSMCVHLFCSRYYSHLQNFLVRHCPVRPVCCRLPACSNSGAPFISVRLEDTHSLNLLFFIHKICGNMRIMVLPIVMVLSAHKRTSQGWFSHIIHTLGWGRTQSMVGILFLNKELKEHLNSLELAFGWEHRVTSECHLRSPCWKCLEGKVEVHGQKSGEETASPCLDLVPRHLGPSCRTG